MYCLLHPAKWWRHNIDTENTLSQFYGRDDDVLVTTVSTGSAKRRTSLWTFRNSFSTFRQHDRLLTKKLLCRHNNWKRNNKTPFPMTVFLLWPQFSALFSLPHVRLQQQRKSNKTKYAFLLCWFDSLKHFKEPLKLLRVFYPRVKRF